MKKTRRGDADVDQAASLVPSENMNGPSRFRKGKTAQKEVVDQAEDGGVHPDAERERDHGEKSEGGRLEKLANGEAKISHCGWMVELLGAEGFDGIDEARAARGNEAREERDDRERNRRGCEERGIMRGDSVELRGQQPAERERGGQSDDQPDYDRRHSLF